MLDHNLFLQGLDEGHQGTTDEKDWQFNKLESSAAQNELVKEKEEAERAEEPEEHVSDDFRVSNDFSIEQ